MVKKTGPRPFNRPSRQQLLLEFDLQKQAQGLRNPTYHYFICDAYPPSIKAISELGSISISKLQLDTHHHGKVLIVRTIHTSFRAAAVQTIVQDDTGATERLALYNTDASTNEEELLPKNAIFAVKEPYYTATAEGSCSLRIDHPSDLLYLNPLDPQVPRGIRADLAELNKSALDWKNMGNIAYSAGRYLPALHAYSRGLDACGSDDMTLKRDLLRNRAVVNLFLKRFRQASEDAKPALIPANAHAAYELGRYQEAEFYVKKVQELAPTNEDVLGLLKRTEQRIREQTTGDYDFMTISRSSGKKYNRLDHADFTSNTTIREAGARGRGLFAAKDIKAGQLVLCEKALCVAFDSDATPYSYTILNPNTQRALAGTQATLLFTLVQKLTHNPELAAGFFDLFDDGGYYPKMLSQTAEGLVPVDTFRAQGIIQHNCFGCPTVRSSAKEAQKEAANPAGYDSTGVWLRASYINHACDGNALRSFIGDVMIVRTVRDVAEGEEILMPYRLPGAINAVTQEDLQKTWAFKCDCGICTAEATSPSNQRKYRTHLIEKMASLLSAHPLSPRHRNNRTHLGKVEQLFAKIKSTYDGKAFDNNPRLGLVAPGLWLCQAYKYDGSKDKVVKAAIALLRDLGFIVTIAGQKVSIGRNQCQLDGTAIEAAMYAADAYHSRGNAHLGRQMEEFAKALYLIMHGEMRGFEDKYKECG